jgi:acyl-coenzyme A synthetase/AMP-(fatty) acid ligase
MRNPQALPGRTDSGDFTGNRGPSGKAAAFAVRHGRIVSRERLWAEVRALAPRLPDRPQVFNLCEDRYLFCLVLLAALLRKQVCLLPPAGQPGVLKDLLRDYPDAYLASERDPRHALCPWFPVEPPAPASATGEAAAIAFDPAQTAVIAFTSGSTGRPKACPKTFGTFETAARLALRGLGLEDAPLTVVSTTPPQHMYGLETSIFWPLFSRLAVHTGWPFFPEDIRRALRDSPFPGLLVSTPTHLRALARSTGPWPNLAGILSSTAGLPAELAARVEQATGARLREIYGSTETLSFATRETAREALWRLYPGVRLDPAGDDAAMLRAPHLERPELLPDGMRIEADGRFALLGRSGDRVKIGGKRASLAELNRRLTDIEGIEDGLCFTVDDGRGECRIAALVVGRLDRQAILAALRPYLDEVFLPRRIHFVAKIPRNAVGKVVREDLEKLLAVLAGPAASRQSPQLPEP